MAFKHGKNTELLLDGADISAYFNKAETGVDIEAADTTTFKSSWKTAIPGLASAKLDLGGLFDPTFDDIDNTLGAAAGSVLSVAPAGATAIGDLVRLVSVKSTAYKESAPVGGVVAFDWSVIADGHIGFGASLHPLGEDTNTTTGATRNDGAASATGWTAHLHVTAVDAGSWVIKLEDASASDFSDGADVTGGGFTAATGATAQRLVSAAGTTALRRYVRYVATRTGGSAGDGITFALAYARNR